MEINKRVRKRSQVWDYFHVTTPTSATRHARVACKACDFSKGSAQFKRDLVKHIEACPGIPVNVKLDVLNDYVAGRRVRISDINRPATIDNIFPYVSSARGETLPSHERMQMLHLALVRFFSAADIPASTVDDVEFRTYVLLLCPGFQFPSRSRLSVEVLNEDLTAFDDDDDSQQESDCSFLLTDSDEEDPMESDTWSD